MLEFRPIELDFTTIQEACESICGSKWRLHIIVSLFRGPKTFSEFLKEEPRLSNNALSQNLKALISANIVKKEVISEGKRRYVYSLTEKGHRLLPILLYLERLDQE